MQAIAEAPGRTSGEATPEAPVEPPSAARGEAVTKVLGFVAVAGATIFVIWQLRPGLLFSPAMDVGGDNAGHVVTPYFLIHDLLPQGRITGWDPQWFEGFPLYVFYFPLPALLVAAFSVVFPYAVAFKLVTVLGSITLPAAAWAFGRLADFKRPIPVLMAAATLPFLFNTSYTIEGGNLTSTLAGEFSFSLALTSGLLFLGVFAYALRTGRLRWLAATLYGVTLLCHVVPALGYAAVAIVLALSRWDKSSWRVLVPVGAVGGLLAAFWLVPFAADLHYSSSMGYTRVIGLWSNILPRGYLWMIIPAGVGTLIALIRLDKTPIVLAVGTVGAVAGFQWLPAGFVYNGRWLPFYFLFTALLAAYGVGEFFRLVGRWLELDAWQAPVATVLGSFGAVLGAFIAGGIAIPGFQPSGSQIEVPGWISWNYTGFQGKSGWPVYQGIVRMLDRAGRTYGCGRLQYEYITETQDPFGSTESTMALPYWTNGCMDTIDGVLFESSTTTPFHFLDQAEYSLPGESSNPVANLNYPAFNLADGIRHLQFAGVRYFLAVSPQVETAAKHVPGLLEIASTPGFPGPINQVTAAHPVWDLYLIKGSGPLVTPLDHLPVVEPGGSALNWLDTNLKWWESEGYWPVELAAERAAELAQSQGRDACPAAAGGAGEADDGDWSAHDEFDRQIRRRASRGAGPGEGAVFPQLARHGSARPVRGLSKFDGSRTDSTSRYSLVRHHRSRPARQARLARRSSRPGHARHAAPAGHEERRARAGTLTNIHGRRRIRARSPRALGRWGHRRRTERGGRGRRGRTWHRHRPRALRPAPAPTRAQSHGGRGRPATQTAGAAASGVTLNSD